MGGSWERQIRSMCYQLATILNEQLLTDETLSTLLCFVEGINGRSITTVSDNVNDAEPFTPNHLFGHVIEKFPGDVMVASAQLS